MMRGSHWMLTATGRRIELDWPQVANELQIFDIAWALAQVNRFNGHALRPYSVAEHSLLVADIVEREMLQPPAAVLAALMHDAHEAYVGDVPTPVKHIIGPRWHAIESEWQTACEHAFGYHNAAIAHAGAIKRADLIALATERHDLLPPQADAWAVLDGIEPLRWPRVPLNAPHLAAHDWEFWRDRFLDRFHELQEAVAP